MKKLIILFFLTSLFANDIIIAAAANVSYAINDIVNEFKKKYPKTNVKVILASSGQLTAQIQNSAPYDIFLSADMKYPTYLYNNGFAITKPVVYAKGAIVFVSFKHNLSNIKDISKLKIALPNPKLAPYGKASVEFLNNAKIKPKNIIYTQTVTQALSYALTATDGAFIAKSAVKSSKLKMKKSVLQIPQNLYTPIKQGMVLLKNGQNNIDVYKFFVFMLSKPAQDILKRYGYIVE